MNGTAERYVYSGRLPPLPGTPTSFISASCVLGCGHWFQVVRIYTRRLTAKMVKGKPPWDGPLQLLVIPAMSAARSSCLRVVLGAVSPTGVSFLPNPTWRVIPAVFGDELDGGETVTVTALVPHELTDNPRAVLAGRGGSGGLLATTAPAQTRRVRGREVATARGVVARSAAINHRGTSLIERLSTVRTGNIWYRLVGHSGRLLNRLIGVPCPERLPPLRGICMPQVYQNPPFTTDGKVDICPEGRAGDCAPCPDRHHTEEARAMRTPHFTRSRLDRNQFCARCPEGGR